MTELEKMETEQSEEKEQESDDEDYVDETADDGSNYKRKITLKEKCHAVEFWNIDVSYWRKLTCCKT